MAATDVVVGSQGTPGMLNTLGRIPVRQLVALMVGGSFAIALGVGAWMWAQSADYRVLYAGVNDRDGGAIIGALAQMNVPYKYAEGGTAILVPADKVHDARLRLASQGLPRGSTSGFELVDNQKFGATQFQEQVNYQRGLEGELVRSIQSIGAVQTARVHLAIPRPSVFLREQQGPSASVLVSLFPGKTLTREQVAGIVNLVASSVPDLQARNVSVIDQNGNLISTNGAGAEASGLDASQLSYVKQVEQATIRRILDIIEPIVGVGNARVQVSADVDFSRIEQVAETFKPNQDPKVAAIRQSQLTQSQSTGASGPGGVPGAVSNQPLTNQPPPAGQVAIDAKTASNQNKEPGTPPSSQRKDESMTYEVDKTIQLVRNPVGGIKRLTAAVVVNHRQQVDEEKNVTWTPLKPEEIEQLTVLAREAMGFSKDRGDSLNVVNTAFNQPIVEPAAELPFWKKPDNIQLAKDVGRYALLIGVIAYLYFGMLRPLLDKALKPAPLPVTAHVVDEEEQQQHHQAIAREPPPAIADARRLARDDPKVVANVVRSWVNKDG